MIKLEYSRRAEPNKKRKEYYAEYSSRPDKKKLIAEYHKEYYQNNRDRIREKQKERYWDLHK